ncbi:hypothetical protein ACFXKG_09795 [Streptomyces sp. NPDC059255]|uniref:hypothetical protein n=1 Tax=Streptomyces sp. NPDC059255 TaxID=3346793 RepID=UPI0036C830BF
MSSRYAEAKPYALPESLADLAGPTRDLVDLPRRLDWGPRASMTSPTRPMSC